MFGKSQIDKIKNKLVNKKIDVKIEENGKYIFQINDKVTVELFANTEEELFAKLGEVEETLEKAHKKKK